MSDQTVKSVLKKIASYCAYQERCLSEVENKLYEFDLSEEENIGIIEWLKAENFLNEERFVASFVRGKFNHKKWGRMKIRTALKQKSISNRLIEIGLKEIKEEQYEITLSELLKNKNRQLNESDAYKRKYKLYNYALSKGFESNIIFNLLDEVLKHE